MDLTADIPLTTRSSLVTIRTMDLGKVSLIVSCLAFLLAIPLSVLGNILTPKVRDWWAANTGRLRLEKRIHLLKEKLRIAEESWCFTNAEWEIYEDSYWNKNICLFGGALLIALIVGMLFLQLSSLGFSGSQLVVSSRLAKQASSSAPADKQASGSDGAELMAKATQMTADALKEARKIFKWISALNLLVSALILWRQIVHDLNQVNHSEKGREAIRQRINKLSQKLSVPAGQGA